eukprot:TRINITY_DN2337_c0_g1_i3.p1 TRINITY_DN2337_c0_g1~~TRINITY_DN2337_c0_g1_i3.p1  ORF type:complete len:226 (-),score=24.99 TRINITY_DN2337_c0_g1_i3:486-1163(-)
MNLPLATWMPIVCRTFKMLQEELNSILPYKMAFLSTAIQHPQRSENRASSPICSPSLHWIPKQGVLIFSTPLETTSTSVSRDVEFAAANLAFFGRKYLTGQSGLPSSGNYSRNAIFTCDPSVVFSSFNGAPFEPAPIAAPKTAAAPKQDVNSPFAAPIANAAPKIQAISPTSLNTPSAASSTCASLSLRPASLFPACSVLLDPPTDARMFLKSTWNRLRSDILGG